MLKERCPKLFLWVGALCFCACWCFFAAPVAEGAAALSLASLDYTPLPPLPQLETHLGDGPEVLAALAALARDGHILQIETERLSPRFFADLTYGYANEPLSETSDERHSYGKLSGTVGVSFPLLGTWTRQKIERIRADLARTESRTRSEMARYNNRIALRKAYAILWSERQRRPILDAFLADEAYILGILEARARKNLVLDSDLLEFASAFDMVRRDVVASKLNVSRALTTVAAATGRGWSLPAHMEKPALPGVSNLIFQLSHHPELRGREEAVRLYEEIAKIAKKTDREANLDVGLAGTRDFPGAWGTGATIGFHIREPFGSLFSKADRAKEAAQSDLERARWESASAEIRLRGNLEEQLLWNDYARESLRVSTTRLEGAQENVRERTLRYGVMPGDTFEQLQRGRYALLRTAMDVLDAESLALQTYIEILALVSLGREDGDEMRLFPLGDASYLDRLLTLPPLPPFPGSPSAAGKQRSVVEPKPQAEGARPSRPFVLLPVPIAFVMPRLPSLAAPREPTTPEVQTRREGVWGRKAAYVWRAEPFLSEATRAGSLDRLKAFGFDRLLLSFNAEEIQSLRVPQGAERLRELLREASRKELVVDLLLGDPAWILPDAREGLRSLLRFFAPFPFRAVHLDLEPDMLPNAERKRDALLTHLLDTLKMATAMAGKPVGVVVHPRYLEGKLGTRAAATFARLGLSEVAVMIYSTNAPAVAGRFKAICRAHPRLLFSLAQSVEKILPRSESYFEAGVDGFERRMGTLCADLSDVANLAGLIVQSYEDYASMATAP